MQRTQKTWKKTQTVDEDERDQTAEEEETEAEDDTEMGVCVERTADETELN